MLNYNRQTPQIASSAWPDGIDCTIAFNLGDSVKEGLGDLYPIMFTASDHNDLVYLWSQLSIGWGPKNLTFSPSSFELDDFSWLDNFCDDILRHLKSNLRYQLWWWQGYQIANVRWFLSFATVQMGDLGQVAGGEALLDSVVNKPSHSQRIVGALLQAQFKLEKPDRPSNFTCVQSVALVVDQLLSRASRRQIADALLDETKEQNDLISPDGYYQPQKILCRSF